MSIQSCYRIFYLCTVVLYGSCQPDDRSNLHKQDCEYIVKKWDKSTTPFTTKGLTPLKKPWWKKKIKIKKIEVPTWLCIAGAGVVGTGLLLGGIIYGVLSHVHTAEDLSSPETELSTTALAPYAEDAALSTHSRYNYSLATGSLALAGATWLANCTGFLNGSREKDEDIVRRKEEYKKIQEAFSKSVVSLKEVDATKYNTIITPIDQLIQEAVGVEALLDVSEGVLRDLFSSCLTVQVFDPICRKHVDWDRYLCEYGGDLSKREIAYNTACTLFKDCLELDRIDKQRASATLYIANQVGQYARDYIKNHPKIKRKKRNSLVKRDPCE